MNDFNMNVILYGRPLRSLKKIGMLVITFLATLLIGCSGGGVKEAEPATITPATEVNSAESKPLSEQDRLMLMELIVEINSSIDSSVLNALNAMFEKHPNNAEVASNYAVALYHDGQTEKAKTIASSFTESALAQNALGVIALANENIAEADSYFNKAIVLDEKYATPYYNLALIYETYYQDLANAIKMYQSYLLLTDLSDQDTQQWVKELEASL